MRRRILLLALLGSALPGCSLVRIGLTHTKMRAVRQGFTERTLERSGMRLRYWIGGNGPPMLLLHGFGGDGLSTWSKQMDILATSRTIIIPDLLWFGESYSFQTPALNTQAEAMFSVLEAEGYDHCDVMGVSYGGFVIFAMAVNHPGIFERAIIVDSPGPFFSEEDTQALLDRFKVSAPEDIFIPESPEQVQSLIDLTLYRDRWIPGFILKDMKKQIFSANQDAQRLLLRELPQNRGLGQNIQISIRKPMVIWGDHDEVFPLSAGEKLATSLGAEWVVIPETAHGPMQEQPERFNEALLNYLMNTV